MTCSLFTHDFMTSSWIVPDFFKTCLRLVHFLFVTFSQLVHKLHYLLTICSQFVHILFITSSLILHDLFVNNFFMTWLHDFFMTSLWLVQDLFVTFSWILHEWFMTCSWLLQCWLMTSSRIKAFPIFLWGRVRFWNFYCHQYFTHLRTLNWMLDHNISSMLDP